MSVSQHAQDKLNSVQPLLMLFMTLLLFVLCMTSQISAVTGSNAVIVFWICDSSDLCLLSLLHSHSVWGSSMKWIKNIILFQTDGYSISLWCCYISQAIPVFSCRGTLRNILLRYKTWSRTWDLVQVGNKNWQPPIWLLEGVSAALVIPLKVLDSY